MSSSTDEKLDEPNAQLRIRPLRAGDDGPIRDIFAGMSAKSRYLRFHSPMPRLSPAMLQRLVACLNSSFTSSGRRRDDEAWRCLLGWCSWVMRTGRRC
jgi:hypothetical protein